MITATQALKRLQTGNARFIEGLGNMDSSIRNIRREELVSGQKPIAIILGCSDSRVPVEIVFDQGLGELFVIRVAGNIAAPSQIGSVEFAVAEFGVRLVVVLGHSNCGAVCATVDYLTASDKDDPSHNRNLFSIIDRVRPSVESVIDSAPNLKGHDLKEKAIRANIRNTVDHLRHGSPIIESFIQDEGLVILGAEYSLETGEVDFFEGMQALPDSSGAP